MLVHCAGGWDLSGLSSCYDYLLNMPTTLRKVGKHLSGWPFEQVAGFCVVMEDLTAMDPEHAAYSENFEATINKIKSVFVFFCYVKVCIAKPAVKHITWRHRLKLTIST